ncbi:MAG TPA: hypothetical protein VMF32_07930 [Xanthobacteraceae bacterium]|nr:hypothetical protein [Xanthobacteraceae bacterium]
MPTKDEKSEYPTPMLAKYFDQKGWLYRLFCDLKPSERWFVLKREYRLIALYILGALLARLLSLLIAVAHAQITHVGPGIPLFGMTPLEVAVLTYWSLHGFLALLVLALFVHILTSATPLPWAQETATFILGFIVHTAVPFPVGS